MKYILGTVILIIKDFLNNPAPKELICMLIRQNNMFYFNLYCIYLLMHSLFSYFTSIHFYSIEAHFKGNVLSFAKK